MRFVFCLHVNFGQKIISVLEQINVYNVYTLLYTGFTGAIKPSLNKGKKTMLNNTSTTNYVPTSIIKVAKNATIPAKAGTLRYKRLAVMQQCSGQTVAAFYAKCRQQVAGTVSKKLLAVAINRGFATVTMPNGQPALTGKALTRYNYKRNKPATK